MPDELFEVIYWISFLLRIHMIKQCVAFSFCDIKISET